MEINNCEFDARQGNHDRSPLQQTIPITTVGATRCAKKDGVDNEYSDEKRVKEILKGSDKVNNRILGMASSRWIPGYALNPTYELPFSPNYWNF